MLDVLMLSLVIVGIALLFMSVGVIMQRKPIQGSCGGIKRITSLSGGVEMGCDFCANGEENPDCEYKQEKENARAQG